MPENTPVGENVGEPVDAAGEDLEYTLTGDDASSFGIVGGTGQLQTKAVLDYETQAAHTVTVTATDSSDASATIDVTINVDNVEEPGTVSLASDRFTVGETIVATLTDPDGSITETTWLWERSLDKIVLDRHWRHDLIRVHAGTRRRGPLPESNGELFRRRGAWQGCKRDFG